MPERRQRLCRYRENCLGKCAAYCFEKKGVLRDENDDDSVIPEITRTEFEQYVADGVIQGGMIPKLENSFEAINAGVTEVVITLASAIKGSEGTRIKK